MNTELINKLKTEKERKETETIWQIFDVMGNHLISGGEPLDWTFKEFRDFIWWMLDKNEERILYYLCMNPNEMDYVMQLISDIKITFSKELLSMFLLTESTIIFKYDKIISTIKSKYREIGFESSIIDRNIIDSWEDVKMPTRAIKEFYEKYLNTPEKTKKFEEEFEWKILDSFHTYRKLELEMINLRNCFLHSASLFETMSKDYSIINFTHGEKLSERIKSKSKLIPKVSKRDLISNSILNKIYIDLDKNINFIMDDQKK